MMTFIRSDGSRQAVWAGGFAVEKWSEVSGRSDDVDALIFGDAMPGPVIPMAAPQPGPAEVLGFVDRQYWWSTGSAEVSGNHVFHSADTDQQHSGSPVLQKTPGGGVAAVGLHVGSRRLVTSTGSGTFINAALSLAPGGFAARLLDEHIIDPDHLRDGATT